MNYFFFNGEWWHCDPKFQYKARDKDGDVWLFTEQPNLILELGTWSNNGVLWGSCLYIGNETVHETSWLDSLEEI